MTQLGLISDKNDMSVKDTIVKGLKAVAAHFGKSERQAQRWAKHPDFPRLSGRRFDLLQIQAWLDKRDGKPSAPPGQLGDPRQPALSASGGKDFQDERLKRAKAEMAEYELKKLRGEIIYVQELDALLTPRARVYRQGLLAFEQKLAPRLVAALGLPADSMRLINAELRQVAREVLENVLRPLILPDGQTFEWNSEAPQASTEG